MEGETRLIGTDRRARLTAAALINGSFLLLLLLLYFGLADAALPILGIGDDLHAHALATLAVGVALVPLRRRVVWLANRALRREWQSAEVLLREVVTVLGRTVDAQALRALLVDDLPRRIQVEGAELWMLERPDDMVFTRAGAPDARDGELLAHGATVGQMRQGRELIHIPSGLNAAWAAPFVARRLTLVIPLRAGDRLVGLYAVGQQRDRRTHPRHVVDLLLTMAPAAASALENARAYTEIARLNEQLQALDKLKDEFIESVGHELRTPLTSLTLALQILAHRPEMAHELADVLRGSVARLQALVDRVLRLDLHLRDDETLPATDPVELRPLLEDIAAEYTPSAGAKGLRVEVRAAEGLAVLGDAAYLRRALHEVVDNAVRYSDRGTVRLTTEVRDGLALVIISDEGPGIPVEERDLLFDVFFRGRGARAMAEKPGAGLGLNLARRDIEALGGRIWLQHTGPEGSTMCVSLPTLLLREASVGRPVERKPTAEPQLLAGDEGRRSKSLP